MTIPGIHLVARILQVWMPTTALFNFPMIELFSRIAGAILYIDPALRVETPHYDA